jgi:hypothetical protein
MIDLNQTTRVAGDVITATNPKLVQQAISNQYCNTLVVKPSQIGTLTETLQAVRMAREAGWSIVVSQRTGETNDDFLADFAVGIGAEFVKFGLTNRGEAVAKYNRLADIYLALEANNQEGAVMPQPNQPNQGSAQSTPKDQPTDPAAGQQPAAQPADDQGVQPASAADTLPKPADAPTQPKAEETLPGAPQNTSIPQATAPQAPATQPADGKQGEQQPTAQAPTAKPAAQAPTAQPAAQAPTAKPAAQPPAGQSTQDISQQVSLGNQGQQKTTVEQNQPADNQSAGNQPAGNQPAANQSEPPINTPPAAAPMNDNKTDNQKQAGQENELPAPSPGGEPSPVGAADVEQKPSEAEVQQAIDNTLQEIGAKPSGGEAKPNKPAAQDKQQPTDQQQN